MEVSIQSFSCIAYTKGVFSHTFNCFKNFPFRALPINKEDIYGKLGNKHVQKLHHLRKSEMQKNPKA